MFRRRLARNAAKTTATIITAPVAASIAYASYTYVKTPANQISHHHTPYSIYYQSITNLFMSKLGAYAIKKFNFDCENAASVNEELLLQLLDRSKDTAYGKDYRLGDIKSREEFRQKHPITTHEHYQPYIDRIYQGETDVMFPGSPRMIGTTSGTSGTQKLVPVPPLQRSVFFTKGIAITFDALQKGVKHKTNPGLHWPNLQKSCKLMHEPKFTYSPTNIKVGPNSSSPKDNKGLLQLYTTPEAAFEVQNDVELLYLHVLFALLDKNLGFIEANFANRVLNFFVVMDEQWDSLLNVIQTGKLPDTLNIPDNIREELNSKLVPNAERFEELNRVKDEHEHSRKATKGSTASLARKIWPNLHTVLASETGTFQVYGEKLREQYIGDDIAIYSPLYAATEGLIGVNPHIHNKTFVLHPQAMFFEFYPIEQESHGNTTKHPYEDEIEPDKTLFLEQLEPGKEYEIIISNLTGLYRYRFGDVVRCVGYQHEAPIVEFAYRKGQFLNIAGERTSEECFYNALSSTVVNDWGLGLKEYTTVEYFLRGSKKPRYIVFVELTDQAGRSVNRAMTKKEQMQLDKALERENKSYKSLRNIGRLHPIEVITIRPGTFEKLRRGMISSGVGATQIKQPRVTRNEKLIKLLEEGSCD